MEKVQLIHLLQRVQEGDFGRFLQTIEPFLPQLKRLCRSMLPNEADSEEVLQETILKALQHIDQLRHADCFKGWLFQIAVNEARLRMRVNCRYASGQEDVLSNGEEDFRSTPALERLIDKSALPFEIVVRNEFWNTVRRGIHGLQPKYREVFVLRDVHGLGVRETAKILSISEPCVNLRLHRARREMRRFLSPHFQPRT